MTSPSKSPGRLRMGRIGTCPGHMEGLDADLVALCNLLPAELEKAGQKYGAKGYLKHQEMLEKEKLDLLVIKTPTPFHADPIVGGLRRGMHVYSEKPLCKNVQEVHAIEQALKSAKGKFQMNLELRNSSLHRRVHDLCQGELGKPVHFFWHVLDVGWSSLKSPSKPWKLDAANTGGYINEKLCHYLDLAHAWLGSPIVRISACGAPIITSGYKGIWDNISIHCWHEGGQTSVITWSCTAPQRKLYQCGVTGTLGSVYWDWRLEAVNVNRLVVTQHALDEQGKLRETQPKRVEDFTGEDQKTATHDNQGCLKGFCDRLLGLPTTTPYATTEDALRLTKICLAAEDSARLRGEPLDPEAWYQAEVRRLNLI